MPELVLCERHGSVALLTLNRPDALNALSRALLEQLEAQVQALAGDADLRAVVVTGAGRAFAAGADIAEMREMTPLEGEAFSRLGHQALAALEGLSVPTLAAVNGFAQGSNGVVVTVNHPPVDGFYVGDSDYVEVITNQDHPTYFMRIFGLQSSAIAARAVAGGGANSSNCVYVLDPTMEGAFLATSSAQLNASCGIMVNSTHPAAMSLNSSTVITAGDMEY